MSLISLFEKQTKLGYIRVTKKTWGAEEEDQHPYILSCILFQYYSLIYLIFSKIKLLSLQSYLSIS